jgi:putative transposase
MSMQGNLSIERMCQLTAVSRAGFYRSLQERQPIEEDMEVRSTIQLVFAEHKRRYGYRRVSKELRRRGMLVNRKRVQRLMTCLPCSRRLSWLQRTLITNWRSI